MKRIESRIGPVFGLASTKTAAAAEAHARAARLLSHLDRARPQLVMWKDSASLIYPVFSGEGEIMYQYTNPRDVHELCADGGRERMGCGGYWDNASAARSAALCHMIQMDDSGIPEDPDLPNDLSPNDRSLLATLRDARVPA